MATIIRRKSDNVVTHYVQSANFDEGFLTFVNTGGQTTISPSTTSSTHEVVDDVTFPTKYWGDMLTYIDGEWAILTDAVANENASRKKIREQTGENSLEDIEIEL